MIRDEPLLLLEYLFIYKIKYWWLNFFAIIGQKIKIIRKKIRKFYYYDWILLKYIFTITRTIRLIGNIVTKQLNTINEICFRII